MKIEYICHAALLIDTGDARIATDPWFAGPAYCGQWHVFPKPVATDHLRDVDHIVVSHGHEDHLHEPTLRTLPKTATFLYPYTWYAGMPEYLHCLGFEDAREMPTFKTHRISERTAITLVSNNLDSVIVVESGGQVLVNVNDSLHSHHANVITLFTRALKARWPRIDMLFCGFGGASYFPNTLHVEGKDDAEVGALREQLFAHNFCRIVDGLQPRVAVPFAADFVLLDPGKTWINQTRFPRQELPRYYAENFSADGGPTILPLYPGDVLEDGEHTVRSPYREQLRNGRLEHLVAAQYGAESRARATPTQLAGKAGEAAMAAFLPRLEANLRRRAGLFDRQTLERARFTVRLTDIVGENCIEVAFAGGEPVLRRGGTPAEDSRLLFESTTEILEYSFASEWGGDVITIGYGCEIYLKDQAAVAEKLDTLCVRLLTNHPVASRYMRGEPGRAAKYLLNNPLTLQWGVRRLRLGSRLNDVHRPQVWLSRTKCEICQICDMPLLDDRFAQQLS